MADILRLCLKERAPALFFAAERQRLDILVRKRGCYSYLYECLTGFQRRDR